MEQTIQVYCKNNGQTLEVPLGCTLEEVYQLTGLEMKHGPISAHVNNKVEGMHFRLYKQKEIEFLAYLICLLSFAAFRSVGA